MTRLIVMGASAGGVDALSRIARQLLPDLPAAVLMVLHVGSHPSTLPHILSRRGQLPASHARSGESILPGRIYVAPPDQHLLVDGSRLKLLRSAKEHHTRPAIDPLFRSAALAHGPDVIGVVLTGMLDDGTAGLQAVKACGGVAVVQDPAEAVEPSMPQSALRLVPVDHCVGLDAMPDLLGRLVGQPGEGTMPKPPDTLLHEQALALGQGELLDHLRAIGQPSALTCPDCHGGLWRVQGSTPPRFRCHTGHGFTARTLASGLADAREAALWDALRATQEQALLLQEQAEAVQQAGQADAEVQQVLQEAERLRSHVVLLRQMVQEVADPEQPAGQPG